METAVVLHGKDDMRVEQIPATALKHGDVRVQVKYVGVCGTDVHFWKSGYFVMPEFPIKEPYVMGHESVGTVVEVAPGVDNLKVGDRVHLHPAWPCGQCPRCFHGRGNICDAIKLEEVGMGHYCTNVVHPAKHCYKLPESMTMEEGALVEPFVVGVYACERARVATGSCVLITGAGGIGLMTIVAAKAAGASSIMVTDLSEAKLEIAKRFGATDTLQVKSRDPTVVAKEIVQVLGRNPDCSIDCSGSEPGIATGILSCKPGGIAAFAGLAPASCTLPMAWAAINEIDVVPVMRYGTCYDRAFAMVASGRVDLKPLVTHKMPMSETEKAFNMTLDPAGNTIKILIDCTQ